MQNWIMYTTMMTHVVPAPSGFTRSAPISC